MKETNVPNHFEAGTALAEFLAGRLGAPECWPNDCKVKPTVIRIRRSKQMRLRSRAIANARVSNDEQAKP